MIKSIYDEKNKFYKHEYYCDKCLEQIKYGEIFRKEVFIYEVDLCSFCWRYWGNKNES